MDYKVVEQKMLRGYILKCAKEVYPDSISVEVIKTALYSVGRKIPADKIKQNVYYLKEKGYIEIKEVELPVLRIKELFIKATGQGIDLVEGSFDDKALAMEE